ncbi:hypothetical protein [Actinacidiphila sp. bgisy167]
MLKMPASQAGRPAAGPGGEICGEAWIAELTRNILTGGPQGVRLM